MQPVHYYTTLSKYLAYILPTETILYTFLLECKILWGECE